MIVSPKIQFSELQRFGSEWAAATHASVELQDGFNAESLERLVDMALAIRPGEFAYVLLELVAEHDFTNQQTLERIFNSGDTAAKVAVCLRSDLNDTLGRLCEECTDSEVQEHLRAKRGKA